MCHNSPYVEQVALPQMKEIVKLYDVDGFFLDIVLQQYFQVNCYCTFCRELYESKIGSKLPTDENDHGVFALRRLKNRTLGTLMDNYNRELMAVKPAIAIITNYAWMSKYFTISAAANVLYTLLTMPGINAKRVLLSYMIYLRCMASAYMSGSIHNLQVFYRYPLVKVLSLSTERAD